MKYGCVRGLVDGCDAYAIIIIKLYHVFFFNSPHMNYLLTVYQFLYRNSYTFKTLSHSY